MRKNYTSRYAISILFACVLFTFYDHLSGEVTFVGDADRLNAFLNFKLDELRSFSAHGYVPNWNWLNLGGFNFGAAYWMYPGFNPDTLAYSMLPQRLFYYAAGAMAATLFFLAVLGAFRLLLDISGHTLSSIVGSCAYAYSSFSLTRIGQGDSAFLTLVLAPWAMLAVRRLGQPGSSTISFSGLTAVMAGMLWFTFLQEVAYVFMLLGAYVVFRSAVSGKFAPILLFAAAALIAMLVAFPRVATVADDFNLFSRLRFIQGTNPIEILRMLSDGIFGRYPEEIALIGNRGFNIHEGLRIFSSSAATIMVVVALCLLPIRIGAGLIMLLTAAIYAVMWNVVEDKYLHYGILAFFVAYFAWHAWHARLRRGTLTPVHLDDQYELWFSVCIVCVVLVVILNSKAGELFHRMFFGVSFIHSRLTISALLPFSVLVALSLKSILPAEEAIHHDFAGWLLRLTLSVFAAAILIEVGRLGVEGVLQVRHWNPRNVHWMRVSPTQAFHVVMTAMAVVACLALARRARSLWGLAELAGLTLCAFIVLESVQFGRMKLFGEQTRTADLPFRSGNYFNPPGGGIRVPSVEQVSALRNCTQNENYRSILIADAGKFPEQPAAHISHLWGLRLMDGYPVLYASVAGLPWPMESISLRSLRFGQEGEIPWRLLANLNVKYAIRLDADLYFGRKFSELRAEDEPDCSGFLLENPVQPLPRQFFVERVVPKASALPPIAGLSATLTNPGWVGVSWWLRWTSATVIVETREVGTNNYKEATNVRMPEAAAGVSLGGLVPGKSYDIRLKHVAYETQEEYLTPPLRVDIPENPREVPALLRAYRSSDSDIVVEWEPTPEQGLLEVQAQIGAMGDFRVLGTIPELAGTARFAGLASGDSVRIRLQKRDRQPYSLHSNTILVSGASGYAGDLTLLQFGNDIRKVSAVAGFSESESFVAEGRIDARYLGDRIELSFSPVPNERFLVINESYHPRWQAFSGKGKLELLPVNDSMIGLRVASGVEKVELKFVPLISQFWIWLFPAGGLALAGSCGYWLRFRKSRDGVQGR